LYSSINPKEESLPKMLKRVSLFASTKTQKISILVLANIHLLLRLTLL